MPENHDSQNQPVPHSAEGFGKIPNDSALFGNVPKASETFRTVRNDSEGFRSFPHPSERKENHTLTVREAARMFEAASVARTERSIVNWCQPNRMGIARLDSYFDPNERKYYLTPESVERAIQEEIQKAAKLPEAPVSEPFGTVPNTAEKPKKTVHFDSETDVDRVRELEKEIMDLRIVNKGKDFFIEQLQNERENILSKLLDTNRRVGELETKLLQLEEPK